MHSDLCYNLSLTQTVENSPSKRTWSLTCIEIKQFHALINIWKSLGRDLLQIDLTVLSDSNHTMNCCDSGALLCSLFLSRIFSLQLGVQYKSFIWPFIAILQKADWRKTTPGTNSQKILLPQINNSVNNLKA